MTKDKKEAIFIRRIYQMKVKQKGKNLKITLQQD